MTDSTLRTGLSWNQAHPRQIKPMGKEEQLLQYWRELNEAQQEQVFQVVRAFKAQASSQAAPTTNPLDLLEAAGLVGHLDFEPEQSYKSAST